MKNETQPAESHDVSFTPDETLISTQEHDPNKTPTQSQQSHAIAVATVAQLDAPSQIDAFTSIHLQ